MHGLLLNRALFRQRKVILNGYWRFYGGNSGKPHQQFKLTTTGGDELSGGKESFGGNESSGYRDGVDGQVLGQGGNWGRHRGANSRIVLSSSSDLGSSWLDKLVYSSYMEKYMPPKGYKDRLRERFEMREMEKDEFVEKSTFSPPVSLKYLMESQLGGDGGAGGGDRVNASLMEKMNKSQSQGEEQEDGGDQSIVQFPFKIEKKTEFVEEDNVQSQVGMDEEGEDTDIRKAPQEVRLQSIGEKLRKVEIDVDSVLEEAEEGTLSDLFESAAEAVIADAGTPDPNFPPSNIPCGGCGALLHCQDQSIPGYISSERFKKAKKKDLMADVCYRCSVLEAHQASLNVNVSCEDYPRIVSKIREKFAMVLLIVDLTDFPCSIWPEILDIIGTRRPIILIGNKVDLLPGDSPEYLRRIEDGLIKCTVDVGLLEANIIHTALVSAKTGYGVENLISAIFGLCKGKGDVFIMGCTNVGKSSLFNSFLQSDLCKPQASDVVQRATISQWPGTTLNLLKFPMSSPSGWKNILRQKRLVAERPTLISEEKERKLQLKMTQNPEYAVLQGRIGKTFLSEQKHKQVESTVTVNDIFHVNPRSRREPHGAIRPGQWDPEDPLYFNTHWVYDTPGAVNSNQILDLLTLPELVQSLPKELITPRSFYVKQNMSVFIGGLARIDFLEGPFPIRYTLFANSSLPVTMSLIEDADAVYEKALGTKVFAVPFGSKNRLSQFPPLESKSFEMEGTGHTYSCADIVLSSIGWVAVTAGPHQIVRLSVHTPNGKGIFLRRPALLPYAVNFKGKRCRGTYSYQPHKLYVDQRNFRRNKPKPRN